MIKLFFKNTPFSCLHLLNLHFHKTVSHLQTPDTATFHEFERLAFNHNKETDYLSIDISEFLIYGFPCSFWNCSYQSLLNIKFP